MKTVIAMLSGLLLSFVVHAEVITISQQQLLSWQASDKDFVLLDVRSPQEYAAGHIKGAINIEFNRLSDHRVQLDEIKDKTVVVYCRSGRRAAVAEDLLLKQNFTALKHLQGDILGWNKAQLPLVR